MKVVVYTYPTCTYYHIVETKNMKAKEEVFKKTGYPTVPITLVDKEYVFRLGQGKNEKTLMVVKKWKYFQQ